MERAEKIQQAVATDSLEQLKELLEDGQDDFDTVNSDGETLLHLAVQKKSSEDVMLFLVDHVNLAQRDKIGKTAFDYVRDTDYGKMMVAKVLSVILEGNKEKVLSLVKDGWDVWPLGGIMDMKEAGDYYRGGTIIPGKVKQLHSDIAKGEAEISEDMVSARDALGMTPLHKAVLMQKGELARAILSIRGVDVNAVDNMRRTALHYAAVADSGELYLMLTDNGADAFIKDSRGKTAEYYSAHKGELNVDNICDLAAVCNNSVSIYGSLLKLHKSIEDGIMDEVEKAEKSMLTMKDGLGMDTLHKSILYGQTDIAEYLIEQVPSSINEVDHWHRSPLHYAKVSGNEKLSQRLIDSGAEMIKDMFGYEPNDFEDNKGFDLEKTREIVQFTNDIGRLMMLSFECHDSIVENDFDRLKSGVKEAIIEWKDFNGLTLIHRAILFDRPDIMTWLAQEFPQSINAVDNMGRTPLHYAAAIPDHGIIYNILAEAGSDSRILDLAGKTAQDYKEHPTLLNIETMKRRIEERNVPLSRSASSKSGRIGSANKSRASRVSSSKSSNSSKSLIREESEITLPPTPDLETTKEELRDNENQMKPDPKYCRDHVGDALAQGIALTAMKRPRDPIEFLAQFLYKYADNKQWIQERENEKIQMEKEREIAERKEEEKKKREDEKRTLREEEVKREKERMEELMRAQKEEELWTARNKLPQLDDEYREAGRNRDGQTRLHLAARLPGVDIELLLHEDNIRVWERDVNGQTAKEIAKEQYLEENVKAIDDYVVNMFIRGGWDDLTDLVLNGYYDEMPNIEEALDDGITDEIMEVLERLEDVQTNLSDLFEACRKGNMEVVKQLLNAENKSYALSRDRNGRSLFEVASQYGHEDVIEYLIETNPECAAKEGEKEEDQDQGASISFNVIQEEDEEEAL